MTRYKPESLKPYRMGLIEGTFGRKNEIVYHPSVTTTVENYVIFFGGDIQDYKENMLKHRDNKHHEKWDLESTLKILHEQFPNDVIIIIKPAKMGLMTFACYENFVEVNNFGAPTYSRSVGALKHLQTLLSGFEFMVRRLNVPIKLIGFSKGSVVLNQLVYSLAAYSDTMSGDMWVFNRRITDFYWLEGGHSGPSETWVTNQEVLGCFAKLKKRVHIHVTPYQVKCDTRPRIGKEERIFRETLIRLRVPVTRVLHFEDEPRSIENHFKVLKVFGSV